MDVKSMLQLMKAAEESGFDTIEITEKDFSMKLDRAKEVVTVQAAPAMVPADAATVAVEAGAPQAPAADAAPAKAAGSKDILSPLVGIFHELPGNKKVGIGDRLKKGDVICTIEAMKLMNEINMPEDGEITWVAVEEGATVEYEQILFSYVK